MAGGDETASSLIGVGADTIECRNGHLYAMQMG
jgi:hypothetical protein